MPIRGTIDWVRHESQILWGNALGDPHIRDLIVYLPPGYADLDRRFPVIYCLTGFTGTGAMFLNIEPWTPNLPQRFESLLDAGRAVEAILVMPDCFTRLGGSQYIDSTATGRYDAYLTEEIVPFVDSRYRTLPEPSRRGIMGKSSGGYGAIIHAMRHPEIFGAVACHSGDMYFEYAYLPDFPKAVAPLQRHGGIDGFLAHFDREVKKSDESVAALNIVAMAACYSPNPAMPAGIDLPFEIETGEIRGDVWARWLEHDPIRILPERAEALRRARLVFLDCGTRDEWNLHLGARIFASGLRERGIAHIHEEFADGHMKITYRYERSLELLTRSLAGA